MIRPDVLLTWPTHVDFPLFRMRLLTWNEYFNTVYIALSYHAREHDFELFLKDYLYGCVFVYPRPVEKDWRQNAVKAMLTLSHSSHVLFLEQDFLMKDEILPAFLAHQDVNQFYGYQEGERIHPALSLVQRRHIESTSQDFSAYPDEGLDHFGKFFQELCKVAVFKDVRKFGFREKKHFYHMAGLTQNYNCFHDNQPFYKPDEFLTYNSYIKRIPNQSDEFLELTKQIEATHGTGDVPYIKKFFP